MKTADGREYSYCKEEQETIHRYDAVDKAWYSWSCIPKHINELKEKGWEIVKEDQYGVKFKAPAHAVKIMPAEKKKRQLSEKQREALAKYGFGAREQAQRDSRDTIADETPLDEG